MRAFGFIAFLCFSACVGTVTGPGVDAGESEIDGGSSCASGTHECAGSCVADDAVATCGSSCTPCSAPMSATATCTNGACGFACAAGFEPCLGRCLAADAGTCPVNLRANVFAPLTTGDVGTRTQAALVYLPMTSEYVLVGGARTHAMQPYDVQVLKLGDPAWRNAFPPGKETTWGPEVGNSTAPGFRSESFEVADTSGFSRPSFEVYGGTTTFGQSAWLAPQNRLIFYLWNRTFSYDAVARAWSFHTPTVDPAGGSMRPRLMWGSMTADSTGTRSPRHRRA